MPRPVLLSVLVAMVFAACDRPSTSTKTSASRSETDLIVGSKSCRPCHEDFYAKWATSFHGLAMQPYTLQFAQSHLSSQPQPITNSHGAYQADISPSAGWVHIRSAQINTNYPIVHVMGGKNVYYFLTTLDRGRLQVLPVAYDVHQRIWFDTAASAVRHFADQADAALDWRDRAYTFNTSCHGCHVSQLTANYQASDDSYRTTWAEPGVGCETCHGPAGKHVQAFSAAKTNVPPRDLGLISTKTLSVDQKNSLCASCHAKMVPLTPQFRPGDRFFDHFDLTALEHIDFYPDGRDLGENYTYTSWLMSPCVKSGQLDCLHCHTSSGRHRFQGAEANQACLPCHATLVQNPSAHSHHRAESQGTECVACHMPKTAFARMTRSDHSMRSPAPAATLAFGSPNACNLCHTNQDAGWADHKVREWFPRDFQKPILEQGRLIAAARSHDWSRLPVMLGCLTNSSHDAVFASSLIRLLRICNDPSIPPVFTTALKDPSPLVRASAAGSLTGHFTPPIIEALLNATSDDYRVVRIQAAGALAGLSEQQVPESHRTAFLHATKEYIAMALARPDDSASHYNLGNYRLERCEYEQAIASFEHAMRLRPDHAEALVNTSIALSALGRNHEAETMLQKALVIQPTNAAIHFNLGLLMAELGRTNPAREHLQAALEYDPRLAAAAYNLAMLESAGDPLRALSLCRRAVVLQPHEPKYTCALAILLCQQGQATEAIEVLEQALQQPFADAQIPALLGHLYEEKGRHDQALKVYRWAASQDRFDDQTRTLFQNKTRDLRAP